MLEDKAWHSSGSAVAVALLNKGGKPCSPVGPGARRDYVAYRLRSAPRHIGAVTGQGIFTALGTWKNPRAGSGISRFGYTHSTPPSRGEEKKGGERHGKAACASVQPVPVRALRPPLLGEPVWTRPNPTWLAGNS